MEEAIRKAASEAITSSTDDTDPMVWGMETWEQIIESLRVFYLSDTPDYKHWADHEIEKIEFWWQQDQYIAFREEYGDGWYVISDEDMEKVRNYEI